MRVIHDSWWRRFLQQRAAEIGWHPQQLVYGNQYHRIAVHSASAKDRKARRRESRQLCREIA